MAETPLEEIPPEVEGKQEPIFGATRFGKYTSPNPLVLGRHDSKLYLQRGGPAFTFYEEGIIGKEKPHAIIVSRPTFRKQVLDPSLRNVFGLTRFGKAGSPSAVIRSRPFEKDVSSPGPGAYELDVCDECRIGISLKGRWPETDPDFEEYVVPGPNRYKLPTFMGAGPKFSLSPKYRDKGIYDSSPGPIYQIYPERRKPLSLTFKPFPITKTESEGGPARYNVCEPAKRTFNSSPSTKFGKGFCSDCEWAPPTLTSDGPGPGAYNLRDLPSIGLNPPVAVLTSRSKTKRDVETWNLYDLFGFTRFGPAGKKNACIASRHELKDKNVKTGRRGLRSPPPEGIRPLRSKKIGISIKSRLKGMELYTAANPGPGTYEIGSCIGQGPAFTLGPRYRGAIGVLKETHAIPHKSTSECTPGAKDVDLCIDKKQTPPPPAPSAPKQKRPTIPLPTTGDIFDVIPYLENMCVNY